jgi:hypothetical protein
MSKESSPVDKRSKKDRRRKFTFSRFIYKGIDRNLERRKANDRRKILPELNKSISVIIDFITGKEIPDVGPEANRQKVERILVEQKGYSKEDIEVDTPLEVKIAEKVYRSSVDLVASVDGRRLMAFKCVAGSLGSREREIIAASRLLDKYQIPFSVASDGKTAIVLDTVSGKRLGEGLNAIFSKEEIKKSLVATRLDPLPEKRIEKEKLIFRSYDSMNVNVKRNM